MIFHHLAEPFDISLFELQITVISLHSSFEYHIVIIQHVCTLITSERKDVPSFQEILSFKINNENNPIFEKHFLIYLQFFSSL